MTTNDPLTTLNPSIIGRTEKVHNAFLDRVLQGTGLDEPQWVTLQLALASAPIARPALVAKIAATARYGVPGIESALDELARAGLVSVDVGDVNATEAGTTLVARTRGTIAGVIGPAYASVPEQDRAVAARVLAQLTDALTAQLDRLDVG